MTWTPTATTITPWGRLRVVVGGKDVTTFRGVETRVADFEDQEPFGSGPAQLVFPGITELEQLGAGALAWLRGLPRPSDVDLYRVAPSGVRASAPLWSGYVSRFVRSADVNDGQLTVECSGAVQGSLSLIMHLPRQNYLDRDIGRLMVRPMRHPGCRVGPFERVETGVTTRKRGSRSQTALDYLQELLSIAQTDDGGQWTLRRDPTRRRSVRLVLKDRTTVHATVRAGGRGVVLSLAEDVTQAPNRIFGEGVGADGNRWRGLVFPNLKPETVPPFPGNLSLGDEGDDVRVWQKEVHSDGYDVGDDFAFANGVFGDLEEDAAREIQRKAGLTVTGVVNAATWAATWANGINSANLAGSRFDPIAADERTVRWLTTSNGSFSEPNPAFDAQVLPVEALVSYGEGISKRKAARWAQRQLDANADGPGWYGTITLTADPVEMSRRDLAAGMNIRLRSFNGAPSGLVFHIASVRHVADDPALPVTLTVDTNARDLLTIVEMRERDRESRQDPARNYLNQRRRSATVRDTVMGWDKESGMGVIPDRAMQGGQWNIVRVPAAQFGAIVSTELEVTPACRFYAAVFGAQVTPSRLAGLVPTPGVMAGEDRAPFDVPSIQDDLGRSNRTGMRLAILWGTPGQAAGYWPGEQEKGHDPTGVLRDDASWDYISADPPWLWLAVWPDDDCTLSGMLKARVDE